VHQAALLIHKLESSKLWASVDEMGFKISSGKKKTFIPEGVEWKIEDKSTMEH